jgi:hypothetical protein
MSTRSTPFMTLTPQTGLMKQYGKLEAPFLQGPNEW